MAERILRWVQRLSILFRRLPSVEKRYRLLLLELPVVSSSDLYNCLRKKTPAHREGGPLVGCSTELDWAGVLQRLRQWEQGTHHFGQHEGPGLLRQGVDFPCVFRKKSSETGSAECQVYCVGADRYVLWDLESAHADPAGNALTHRRNRGRGS